MSPVPPVLHTVVSVSIGLKTVLRMVTSIGKAVLPVRSLTLSTISTEDRLIRHASGPVQSSNPLHVLL